MSNSTTASVRSASIARLYNVAESAIVRVEEWANVFFAIIKGVGARFVSKKAVAPQHQTVSQYAAAEIAAAALENAGYAANIWAKKEGEVRVYVKDGRRDCGYVLFVDTRWIRDTLYKQAGTISGHVADALRGFKIAAQPTVIVSKDPLTQKVVEQCWECGAEYSTYGNVETGNMCCRRCA